MTNEKQHPEKLSFGDWIVWFLFLLPFVAAEVCLLCLWFGVW